MSIDNGPVVSRNTPREQRVYMSEGNRLPGCPTRFELMRACTVGARIGNRRRNRRIKCPSRVGPTEKRWTTLEAWNWYDSTLNGDGE